jgi:hypothetical protein
MLGPALVTLVLVTSHFASMMGVVVIALVVRVTLWLTCYRH